MSSITVRTGPQVTAADVQVAWALCTSVNAALTRDAALDDPDAWVRPDTALTVVSRDGVTWYGVHDLSSMPFRGWVADAPGAGLVGVALTDAAVDDPAADLSGLV